MFYGVVFENFEVHPMTALMCWRISNFPESTPHPTAPGPSLGRFPWAPGPLWGGCSGPGSLLLPPSSFQGGLAGVSGAVTTCTGEARPTEPAVLLSVRSTHTAVFPTPTSRPRQRPHGASSGRLPLGA